MGHHPFNPEHLGYTRRDFLSRAGMGLGVFIAKTLLEHTGARVNFGNRREGGARVAIVWPRAILEAENGGSEPDMPVASQPQSENPTAANT